MNLKKVGKLIREARKEAGFTQKQLASLLYVTDKAVSKWERGLSTPDSALLPRLSMLLDLDIEHLIPNNLFSKSDDWQGLLVLNNNNIPINTIIYDKPLLHYLLSYFMLVGITNITIKGVDKKHVESLSLRQYGLNITYDLPKKVVKKMIVYDKTLFFGANITRLFKSYMDSNVDIKIYFGGKELPILFANSNNNNIDEIRKKAEIRTIGRGMINIPLNNKRQLNDASRFVEIYQRNNENNVYSLNDLFNNRIKKLN